MATLRNHKGILTIFVTTHNERYAVCKDGKILRNTNRGDGWKLASSAVTVDVLRQTLPVDRSNQAQAIITRANHDAAAHERSKRIRRSRRQQ